MNQVFIRSEQLSEKIHDIKLHIPAWKVLFAMDGQMNVGEIASFLEMDPEEVNKAVSQLAQMDLIVPPEEGKEAESPVEIAEEPSLSEEEETVSQLEIGEIPMEESAETGLPEMEQEVEEAGEAPVEEEQPAEEFSLELEEPSAEETEEQPSILDLPVDETEESSEHADQIGEEFEELKIEEMPETEVEGEPEEAEQDLDTLINDLLKEESESEESEKGPQILDEEEIAAWDTSEELSQSAEVTGEPEVSKADEMLEIPDDEAAPKPESSEAGTETVEEEVEMLTPPPAEGRKTILVVDDSIVIRKMVEIALENENYNVVSVATGKEAFSFLDEKDPELVILDIMLPDVNGLDILKTIKSKKDIPVVMLSAKDTPKETSKAKELGANDFIPKPFRDEELVSKIHELIGQ